MEGKVIALYIQVMVELCLRVLVGLLMPAERTLGIVVPVFRKGDFRNCCCYRALKLHEYGYEIGGKGVRKRLLNSDY